jgi:elongation factor P--beta-lysine ligase
VRGRAEDRVPAAAALTWNELYRGSRSIFADAGFTEVSRPTLRRVVMRIDFDF